MGLVPVKVQTDPSYELNETIFIPGISCLVQSCSLRVTNDQIFKSLFPRLVKKFLAFTRNPKVHYHVHKIPLPDQMNKNGSMRRKSGDDGVSDVADVAEVRPLCIN
jgi:hypothetical protein